MANDSAGAASTNSVSRPTKSLRSGSIAIRRLCARSAPARRWSRSPNSESRQSRRRLSGLVVGKQVDQRALDRGLPGRGVDLRAEQVGDVEHLSLIHISEPTRLGMISYAVFCL